MHRRRVPVDALKLIASQFIVWHHFAAYGPLADTLSAAAPALMAWLYDYARMAVQVFLVLSGYLAVQSLAPGGVFRPVSLGAVLVQRYLRLVLPFGAALLLAVACATWVRPELTTDFVPDAAHWLQVLAHLALLHSLLGFDALSAGVWYVAIDFQLFALLAVLLWLGKDRQRLAQGLVLALMLASLLGFNRNPVWDDWALYFFGSYGMGVAAYWAATSRRPFVWLLALLATGALALQLQFRPRIALAWGVALLLGLLRWYSPVWPEILARVTRLAGRTSYALFLVHFPVLLLGNWLYLRLGWSGVDKAVFLLLACWIASMLLAWAFERGVEAPLARWYQRRHGLRPI